MKNLKVPVILAILITGILLVYNFLVDYIDPLQIKLNFTLEGYEKVIDGVITFTSIIIGFLVAILTILLSSRDSQIMNRILNGKEKEELRTYFLSSFIIGGLLVFNSIIMYVARYFSSILVHIFFYSWIFLTAIFTIHLILFLSIIMKLLFQLNEDSKSERQDDDII
ncbi:hypothetical protein [Exiguobacterium sp. KJ 601]|uniref:hypothetical protein n=1 Tax=Exiguobacterium sp. KJ 601 TaxID=2782569 RepID=UPI0022AFF839|nr:hypothetical protein [Exiguobacterium sp. KJ 601]